MKIQIHIDWKGAVPGFDPTIAIMHERRDGSSAFIFDLMEPVRPAVDRKVLEFIKGQVFGPADFGCTSHDRLVQSVKRCFGKRLALTGTST